MKTEIKSNWSHAVLVCKKCAKKQKKRRFGRKRKGLASALRAELGAKKGRKSRLGVVEAPCFDICPKNGVVVVDTRAPGQWRIVTPDADIGELARQLSDAGR
jgi:predicted metal-binding protein